MKTFLPPRLRHLALLAIILISSLPTRAEEFTFEGITYTILDKEAKTCATKAGRYDAGGNIVSGDLVLPENPNGYKLVEIADNSFTLCEGLTSVTIPNSVISIGDVAFYACSGLTSVTIPNSVTSIGSGAFYACSGLTSVTIPNSVTSIGSSAFIACRELNSVVIPGSITSIADETFKECEKLTSITIPSSVTSIGNYAFWECTSLKDVNIPNSVTSIGTEAFFACSGLTSVTIPTSVTSIAEGTFMQCKKLTSITIPSSVTSIGDEAFWGCLSLKDINIPNSVTSIGSRVFRFCSDLKSVIIPGSVKSMGHDVFDGNPKLIVPTASFIPLLNIETCSDFKGMIICRDIKYSYSITRNTASITITTEDNPYYDNTYPPTDLYADIYYGSTLVSSTPLDRKGSFTFDDFEWYEFYTLNFVAKTKEDNDYTLYSDYIYVGLTFTVTTKPTQTTVTLTFSITKPDDDTFTLKEYGVYWNGSSQKTPVKDKLEIKNLDLNTEYSYIPYIIYNGDKERVYQSRNVTTLGWEYTYSNIQEAPTTAILKAKYNKDGVKPDKVWWEFDGQKIEGSSVTLVSLTPNSNYSAKFNLSYKEKTYTESATFKTSALEIETLTPKCVSTSCAIVAAKTNISDWEPMAGFEWKKYDAPESLAPSKGYGAVCDGVLEGYIKNLQAGSYYNVRPFYQDAQGNTYYGNWVTFDPSDFSYFEPTVRTYPVQEVTTSSATVRGYALSGTDNIISQGFQYWRAGNASAKRFAPAADEITTVPVSGQIMTATFDNLDENTTYVYRAYVETEAGFTYGEEMTFTTESASGINEIWNDDSDMEAPTVTGYYDLHGRRYNTPQPGLNIVLYSDGSTRKIMVNR